MSNIIKLIVENLQKNSRVDYYLSQKCRNISRTKIKSLILKEFLKVNEKIVKEPSLIVRNGDVIEFKIIEAEEISLKPFDYNLDIVFEDNDIISKTFLHNLSTR